MSANRAEWALRDQGAKRRGLTLLEVILSLAILAGAVAVLGELLRTGMMNASDARDFTRAEMHASSIMSQVVAGAITPEAISMMPVEDDPDFSFSIASDQAEQGLLRISVTVARNQTSNAKPPEFTLVRWMVDPQMEMNLAAQAQANADAAAAEKAAQEEAQQQQQQQQQNSSQSGAPQGGM
jgi:prepilin-type N-terminal cleavage/methylation domain-containing protein